MVQTHFDEPEPKGPAPFGSPVLDTSRNGCRVLAAFTDALACAYTYEAALASVSTYRQRKVRSYRFGKDRRTSLLAALLLDELLQEHGLRERNMAYMENERGKPLFRNHTDLHFSLAHSGEASIAALSPMPVGVDVEYLPDFPRDVAEPHAWTEMESVGKLLGCGVGAFVDSRTYSRPEGIEIEHVTLGDYLFCIASNCWFNM